LAKQNAMPKPTGLENSLPALLRMGSIDMLLCNSYIMLRAVIPSIKAVDVVRIFKDQYNISEEDLAEDTALHKLYRYDGKEMRELNKTTT
jgi:hypothetical protein